MKSLLKKIAALLLFRPYFRLRSSGPVRFYFNHEAANLQARDRAPFDGAQARVVADLRRHGIAVTHVDELFPGKNVLPSLREYAERLRPAGVIREGKPFLMALWPDNAVLRWENPFVRLALDDAVMKIVNAYLGLWAKFFYCYLDITLPVPPGAPPFRSQNWHRDPEDKTMCKMFVYLTDVDQDSGPFIYLRGSHSEGKWGGVFGQNPPKGSYPPEEAVRRIIPEEAKLACTGKAGTVVFGDTAGLHRGGYATAKERWMFTADFSSPAALRPTLYRLADDFPQEFLPHLSPAARYALEGEQRLLARSINGAADFALKYGLY